jgi:hypothetical protein
MNYYITMQQAIIIIITFWENSRETDVEWHEKGTDQFCQYHRHKKEVCRGVGVRDVYRWYLRLCVPSGVTLPALVTRNPPYT